jgi:hypothetical protein
MGWKCGCIFVGEIEDGYFSTGLKHSPEKAREIRHALGQDSCKNFEPHHMDIYPNGGMLVIGAFERGAFIADREIIDQLEKGDESYCQQALSCYPGSNLLALGLHSVVNYAAFAYYREGQLLRSFACASDPGIIRQFGEMLPEEVKAYAGSFARDGQLVFPRTFDGRSMEFDIAGIAEEIVFDLSSRPFETRLDSYVEEDVFETEVFYGNSKPQPLFRPQSSPKPVAKPFWKFW